MSFDKQDDYEVSHRFTLDDGSAWESPSSWYKHSWPNQAKVKEAAELVRWYEKYYFHNHIVLTYARRAFTQAYIQENTDQSIADPLTQWTHANGVLKDAITKETRYPSDMVTKNRQVHPEAILRHTRGFLEEWIKYIRRMPNQYNNTKIHYLAVIEPNPWHIHILTMNTDFLVGKGAIDNSWQKGWTDFTRFTDDQHKNNAVAYLFKTYGEADEDMRFSIFKLPSRKR